MLNVLVSDWFNGTMLADSEDYTLYGSAPEKKECGLFCLRGLFNRQVLSVRLLVCLKTDVVNFRSMASAVLNHYGKETGTSRHVEGVWLVVSPRGGIYLHETIALRENIRYPGMKNRFVVFNSGDGSFSFGPGHASNRVYTERMRDLLSRSKLMVPAEFLHTFGAIMGNALELKG